MDEDAHQDAEQKEKPGSKHPDDEKPVNMGDARATARVSLLACLFFLRIGCETDPPNLQGKAAPKEAKGESSK